MRRLRRSVHACLIVLLLLPGGPAGWAAEHSIATVVTDAGVRIPFHVEVVDTPAARARGLMFRKHLAADAGMLFLFERSEVQSFWMKNTELPLDMLFIDATGRIVDLHRDAEPFSTSTIVSAAPAIAVLEVLAGTSARLGIRAGDRVEHPAFPIR